MNRAERRRTRKLKERQPTGPAGSPPFAGTTAAAALQQAARLFGAGRLRQAHDLSLEILAQQPTNPDALNLAGVCAARLGDEARGIELLRAAVAANPRFAPAHNSLGNVLAMTGQAD